MGGDAWQPANTTPETGPMATGCTDVAEAIGGDGVMGGMRTPTVTEIPLSLARVEPDPFIEAAPSDRPVTSGKKPAPDRA